MADTDDDQDFEPKIAFEKRTVARKYGFATYDEICEAGWRLIPAVTEADKDFHDSAGVQEHVCTRDIGMQVNMHAIDYTLRAVGVNLCHIGESVVKCTILKEVTTPRYQM